MERDFSIASKQRLLKLVEEVENEKYSDFTDFIGDRWLDFQSWIGLLNIKGSLDNINKYHKKVIDKNNTSASEIEEIFNNVNSVSDKYKLRFSSLLSSVQQYRKSIVALADVVQPSNGKFNVESISNGVGSIIDDYLYSEALRLLDMTDISYDNLQEINGYIVEKILYNIISSWLNRINLPDIKMQEKREFPLDMNTVLYYEVSGTADINSQSDIELIIK